MANHSAQLIACHDCDLLQQEIPLKSGCTASCSRCGAILYRNATDSINRTLAYTLAASILFVLANIFPIFSIDVQGGGREINLSGAVRYLWDQQMKSVALLVVLTTILIPALELVTMSYLLLSLKLRSVPVGYRIIVRMISMVGPWSMIDVFMLGVLVSLVKLTNSFTVIPGIALWSFGALTFLYAATSASFSARDVWARLDRKRVEMAA
ncbi:MAG: paraquat-inducible protein A [Desulfuromonadaceae bacterium]